MGSNPSFNPSVFTGSITQKAYDEKFGANSGDPLLNRAIQSVGPTGSNYKPITAVAALESGKWGISQVFDDTGKYCVGSGAAQQCRQNSGGAADGAVNLVQAIKVSDDNFFYNLGVRTNANPTRFPNGGPLQQWSRKFGIGRNPGIDLPNAESGTLPDPRWRNERNKLESQCDTATVVPVHERGTLLQLASDEGLPPQVATPPGVAGSPTAPTARGPKATTRAWRSARATSRCHRCNWRWPTRRSPTGARRHPAYRVEHRERRRHRAAEGRPRHRSATCTSTRSISTPFVRACARPPRNPAAPPMM